MNKDEFEKAYRILLNRCSKLGWQEGQDKFYKDDLPQMGFTEEQFLEASDRKVDEVLELLEKRKNESKDNSQPA